MSHPQTAPRLGPVDCERSWLSLVVPVCTGLDLSRACFASILLARESTGLPQELIFVDNGSQDGSAEWLHGLQARFDWVRVMSHAENMGFAEGCNAGLRSARGEYLAIVNNDTLVGTQVFTKLLAALESVDNAGLIAPVSNYVMGQQLIELLPGEGPEDVESIARRLDLEAQGKISEVDRLAGLCLVGRRQFFEQVGLFDPAYGLGNYEDEDLGLRARIAGYSLMIAQDAYVHHFGNKSFQSLGLDYDRQLERQLQLHRNRWKGCRLFLLEEALEAKDYDGVLDLSQGLEPEVPGLAWCLRIQARALVERQRDEEALPLLEEFVRHHPLHTESACLLAFCLLETGRVKEGRLQMVRALRDCHLDDILAASVLARLARWCWSHSLREEAQQHLASAYGILPGFLPAKIVESSFLLEEERYSDVLTLLSPLRVEAHTDIFTNLGIAHYRLDQLDQAIADFQEGARIGGPHCASAQNLAQFQLTT